jgi:hypothetical protein
VIFGVRPSDELGSDDCDPIASLGATSSSAAFMCAQDTVSFFVGSSDLPTSGSDCVLSDVERVARDEGRAFVEACLSDVVEFIDVLLP